MLNCLSYFFFFFKAEDGIRVLTVTGVQTCALPISRRQGRDLPKRLPLEDARGIMTTFNRREFLETSAGVIAAGMSPPLLTQSKKPLRLGLIIGIGNEPEAAIAKVHDLGLPTGQVYVEGFDPGLHTRLLQALDRLQIAATSVVVGGPGREVWDFYEGPLTIGVVPPGTRAARIARMKQGSDFAKACGIPAVQS